MSIIDKITNALGIYSEDDDYDLDESEVEEEIETKNRLAEKQTRRRPFENVEPRASEEEPRELLHSKAQPSAEQKNLVKPRRSIFSSKKVRREDDGNKTISIPLNQKQIKVVVIEPVSFDDSQKVADYLRANQPVVINFEGTDKVTKRRMTDFIGGTIYALAGSVKQIGANILVCAPKNVDVDADAQASYGNGENTWKK